MAWTYRFKREAADELESAVSWYIERSPAVALQFVDMVEAALARLMEFPASGVPYVAGTRKLRLRTFPYTLIYRNRSQVIEIVAISHSSQRPGYWRHRL